MREIRTESEYKVRFPQPEGQFSEKLTPLDLALDIRKFEIDLYWKRAGYFWTLIGASFAGYFALRSSSNAQSLMPLVACVGFILSLGWYLVNRGSKYWQENWERHVDLLESKVIGPLYKTTISGEEFPFLKFWNGYPYSVSKVNQLISLFVTLVWLGLVIGTLPNLPRRDCLIAIWPWVLFGLTFTFSIFLLTLGKGGSEGRARRINFRESSLEATKGATQQTMQKAPPQKKHSPD